MEKNKPQARESAIEKQRALQREQDRPFLPGGPAAQPARRDQPRMAQVGGKCAEDGRHGEGFDFAHWGSFKGRRDSIKE